MPAVVETMMYAGQTPWHGLGTHVGDDAVTSAVALQSSGLDWTVDLGALWAADGPELVEVPSHRAVIRNTDGAVLGVVGRGYDAFQPHEIFEFLDTLTAAGQMKYDTAGSLSGGKKVWVLAELPGDVEPVKGDKVETYILGVTSYDGSMATRFMFVTVRVVCQNTLTWAMSDAKKKRLTRVSIRHTRNQRDRLDDAAAVLGFGQKQQLGFQALSKALARYTVSDADRRGFLDAVAPLPVEPETDDNQRRWDNARQLRARLLELEETQPGADLAPGTAWNLANTATYVSSHEGRDNGTDSRFSSILLGGSRGGMNDRAMQYVTTLVA